MMTLALVEKETPTDGRPPMSAIEVLWCRPRSRRICRICGLAPVEPPHRTCSPCLARLAGPPRSKISGWADFSDADLFRAILEPRPERLLDGIPERLIPSAQLPAAPDEAGPPPAADHAFAAIQHPDSQRRLSPGRRALLAAVTDSPDDVPGLVERTGLAPGSVRRFLIDLATAGLIGSRRVERRLRFYAIDDEA